jgi:hypothetical protein
MKRFRLRGEERGAVLALTALLLIVAALCMALAIDLGHLYVVKCELQRAADAGAMAAALSLYDLKNPTAPPVCSRALGACQTIVGANQADGAGLQILADDVIFGRWDGAAFQVLGSSDPQINAVQVVVRRDQTANGPVPLFFAGLLPGDLGSVNLTAQAAGVCGGTGYLPPGAGAFPLAIDVDRAPADGAGKSVLIDFNPTTVDSGCWHTFLDPSTSASDLQKLVNGTTPSPALKVGDQISVSEGVVDSVLQEMERIFTDRSHNNQDWVVKAPIIPSGEHAGQAQVLGFVAFKVTLVEAQGADKRVEGITVPNPPPSAGAPGGPSYGLLAMPRLVQ